MQIPMLPLSFLTFRIDFEQRPAITVSHPPPFSLNNARIQLESRCVIHDRKLEKTTEYFLGASCKTERVGVTEGVWLDPNADFCPILSQEEFLDLKSWAQIGIGPYYHPPSLGRQGERQYALVADAFDRVDFNVQWVEGEALTSDEEIVQATLANEHLAGRIEFTAGDRNGSDGNEEDRYEVLIDFPIKTMNANERDNVYQTDTGPILFPDFSVEYDRVIETFHKAYVAYNTPDWAEFIVQVPTALDDEIATNHYSRSVRLETKNTVFRQRL